MPSITQSIEVGQAPERVWAVLTDTAGWSEWLTIHAGWPQGEPTIAQGTDFVQKLTLMGMPADVNWAVVALEEQRELALEGAGPMGVKLKGTWSLEPADGGTQVSYAAEFSGGAIDGPLGEAVAKQAGAEAGKSLEKLKAVVG